MSNKEVILCKKIFHSLAKAAASTVHHDGVEHAGYMAFMTLLSLFPFLVFFVACAGFLGASSVGVELLDVFMNRLPQNVMHAIAPRIKEIISGPPQSLMTIAIIGVIWTASSSVEGLRTILNRVHEVRTPPKYIFRRMLSIVQFLILTAFLTITMFLFVFIPILLKKLPTIFNINYMNSTFDNVLSYSVAITVLLTFVASLYYYVPNLKMRWRAVLPGAVLVVVLWYLSGVALSVYIENFRQLSLVYGSLGGVIVTLLFFYIVNLIFIFGAEFNHYLSK